MLATVATVIASQAVISGAFSVTQQVIQLGFLPRMSIRHTSKKVIGQIYIPIVNWLLLFAVIVLVLTFRSSDGPRERLWDRPQRDLRLEHVPRVRRLPHRCGESRSRSSSRARRSSSRSSSRSSRPTSPRSSAAAGSRSSLGRCSSPSSRPGTAAGSRWVAAMREGRVSLRRYINRMIDEPPNRIPGSAVFLTTSLDTVADRAPEQRRAQRYRPRAGRPA